MLTPEEVRSLNWHPLRDTQRGGRPENYALSSSGYDAKGGLRYFMACGHRSVPRLTVCERGCRTAPAWEQPLKRNTTLQALSDFATRYDPSKMPTSRREALWARARALGAERGYAFAPRQVA